MLATLLALSLWSGSLGTGARDLGRAFSDSDALQRSFASAIGNFGSRFIKVEVKSDDDSDSDDADSDDDSDSDATAAKPATPAAPAAPHAPAMPAMPGMPAIPAIPPVPPLLVDDGREGERPLPLFSEKAKGVPAVDVLHRIARTAGWSMTLVGVGEETIDVDLKDKDPREALRAVLAQSHSMGVLRGDKLVVLSTPDAGHSGMVIVQPGRRVRREGKKVKSGTDMVKVFQGDVTVPSGTVLHGDAVAIGGSIEVEQGAVVEGNAVAVLGSVTVDQGAVVLGDGVAVLGGMEVERGGKILGEKVEVGMGKVFSHHRAARSGFLSRLGPFGFFPSVALFALLYLCGLFALRTWPTRVRSVGVTIASAPLRSFFIGFVCWLLFLPLTVLLCVSVVGLVLVPLLPLAFLLSVALGLTSVALRIGESLPAGPGQHFVPPAALGMGVLVLLLISFVPMVGVSLLALAQFFALGGAVGSRFGKVLPAHV